VLVIPAKTEAHRKTVQSEIQYIAQFLLETLGSKLVAFIAGVGESKTVQRWASGERNPKPDAEERLRATFQVFQLLQQQESAFTIRAWFIGLNPQLDDIAPARALRDGHLRDVLVAAESYNAGG
jgi:hypothetical protein